jgi:hypothetical protein
VQRGGAQTTVFNETFDKCTGTGGNDDKWSGNIASSTSTVQLDNTWSTSYAYGGYQCVKLGKSKSGQGSATTPTISLTGNGKLTFKAGAWAGDATTLNISASGAKLSKSSVTLADSKFTDYSIDITNATGSVTITFTGLQKSKSRFFLDEVKVTKTSTKTATQLTFTNTGDKTFTQGDTDGLTFTNAATLTPAVDGATITYSSSDKNIATVDETGKVSVKTDNTGSATITATYAGDDTYASSTASYKITVAPKLTGAGTKANPYTVADAIALVNAGQTPSDNVYVKGIISQLDKYYSNYKQIDYWISDDGKTTKQIEMYNGKGLNNADFSALSDLALGWTVTVYGKLTEYSNTIEMERGNYITSIEKPNVNVPAITGTETFLDKTTVTITADEGSTITYTTDGSDPTTVSGATTTEGNTVSFDITATTTVKAVAMDANANLSSVAEKTFTKTEPITVAEALQKKDGTEVIVKGIVASVSTWNSKYPNVNYWISDDGSTTSELEIFRGTGLNGAKITSQNDITKGDIVILRGKLTTYNNTKELAEGSTLLSITKSDEKATVTAAGWATYVTNNAVSFPEGVTAYTVTYDATADKITLNPVTAVPAKTAVVLKAAAGTYTLTKVESAEAPTSNDLTYSLSDKTIADGDNIYVLAQNNGVIGFWPTEVGSTLAAFKGYLDLGSNSSAKSFFAHDGTATGINSINADKANTRDVRFNLAGQRVGKDYKGVVVVNGKKMLVK